MMKQFEVGKIYLTTGGYALKVIARDNDSVTIINENKCSETYKIHNTPTCEALYDVTAKYDLDTFFGSKTYRTTLTSSNDLDSVAYYIKDDMQYIVDDIRAKFAD